MVQQVYTGFYNNILLCCRSAIILRTTFTMKYPYFFILLFLGITHFIDIAQFHSDYEIFLGLADLSLMSTVELTISDFHDLFFQ